jgi:hypothetical protein
MACQRIRVAGSLAWLCGDFEDDDNNPCSECGIMAAIICDFPIGDDKTCDRLLCKECAVKIRGDIDYCPSHAKEYGKILNYQKCEQEGSGI